MRFNETTAISTNKVVLVPYRREHVEVRYNQWMQSPELQELTASEPLSLEDEYQMQESWREDDDKLTFILLGRPENSDTTSLHNIDPAYIQSLPMIGDVNVFFKQESNDMSEWEAELEIMIAEANYRRRGAAFSALSALLHYITTRSVLLLSSPDNSEPAPARSSVQHFMLVARISASNKPSISLFERLGFSISKPENVFGEVEMRFTGNPAAAWGESGIEWHFPERT